MQQLIPSECSSDAEMYSNKKGLCSCLPRHLNKIKEKHCSITLQWIYGVKLDVLEFLETCCTSWNRRRNLVETQATLCSSQIDRDLDDRELPPCFSGCLTNPEECSVPSLSQSGGMTLDFQCQGSLRGDWVWRSVKLFIHLLGIRKYWWFGRGADGFHGVQCATCFTQSALVEVWLTANIL